jgi:hypothetical protein
VKCKPTNYNLDAYDGVILWHKTLHNVVILICASIVAPFDLVIFINPVLQKFKFEVVAARV